MKKIINLIGIFGLIFITLVSSRLSVNDFTSFLSSGKIISQLNTNFEVGKDNIYINTNDYTDVLLLPGTENFEIISSNNSNDNFGNFLIDKVSEFKKLNAFLNKNIIVNIQKNIYYGISSYLKNEICTRAP